MYIIYIIYNIYIYTYVKVNHGLRCMFLGRSSNSWDSVQILDYGKGENCQSISGFVCIPRQDRKQRKLQPPTI